MKILIPTIDEVATLNSQPSKIFGNAKSFLIYNTNTDQFYTVENTFYVNRRDDLEIAEDLKALGIDNIITENICKGCHHSITAAGIEIWSDPDSIYVRESCQKFVMGGLFIMSTPAHLSMHKIVASKQQIEELEQYT